MTDHSLGALRRFDRWLQAPAPPERLAMLRIAICGFVTVYLAANVGEFSRLGSRTAAEFEPVGLARLLDGPLAANTLWIGFGVLLALGTGATAGWQFRFVGPLFAIGVLGWASYHSSWGQLLHFEHLFTVHLLILGLAPASDAWSLGASSSTKPVPLNEDGARYGWPIRLMAIATVTTYLLSGIAKLRHTGLAWFDPETLTNHIAYSATRIDLVGGPTPPLAQAVVGRDWLIAPMAAAGLATEVGAPLALFGGRIRTTWVIAAIGFHAATAATMLVFFGYRGLGFALLPLFAVDTRRVAK